MMFSYFILIFPLITLGLLNFTKEFNKKQIIYFASVFLLIYLTLFSGLRHETGFDFSSYKFIFETSINRDLIGNTVEPGFLIINQLVYYFTENYNLLLLVVTFINMYFIVKFTLEDSPFPLFSLYLYVPMYFIGGITGQMRQAVAVSILTYAFKFIKTKEKSKFFFVVVLASLFHISSLIFLIIYFVPKLNIDRKKMITISFIAVISGYLNITKFLIPYLDYIPLDFFQSVMSYSEGQYSTSMFLSPGYLERGFVLVIILYFYKPIIKEYENGKLMIYSYWINALFYFIFTNVEIFARRFSLPFKIVDIILLAMILGVIKNKKERAIFILFFTLLFMAGLFATISNPSGSYIPYEFIFNS